MLACILLAACGGGDDRGDGPWQFKVDTLADAAGTRQTSWLRSVGQEGAEGAARTDPAILSFDCFRGNVSATIMTDQSLRQGSTEIQLSLDAGSPRPIPAFAGTTPTGGMVRLDISQDSMLALLRGHQRATIEYRDGAGSSHTIAEFPVSGVEQYRAPFLAACAERGDSG